MEGVRKIEQRRERETGKALQKSLLAFFIFLCCYMSSVSGRDGRNMGENVLGPRRLEELGSVSELYSRMAELESRKVVLVVSTTTCPPCQRYKGMILEGIINGQNGRKEHLLVYTLKGASGEDVLTNSFNIRSVPLTLYLWVPKGKNEIVELDRFVGPNIDGLRAFLEKASVPERSDLEAGHRTQSGMGRGGF